MAPMGEPPIDPGPDEVTFVLWPTVAIENSAREVQRLRASLSQIQELCIVDSSAVSHFDDVWSILNQILMIANGALDPPGPAEDGATDGD